MEDVFPIRKMQVDKTKIVPSELILLHFFVMWRGSVRDVTWGVNDKYPMNHLIYKSLVMPCLVDVGEGSARGPVVRVMVDIVDAECRGDEDCESEDDFMAHCDRSSIGKGKMMVEFFSALIELSVWR